MPIRPDDWSTAASTVPPAAAAAAATTAATRVYEAMLLAADDYDSPRETLAVLSDSELIADLREGEAALAAGDHVDEHELTEMMRRAGRPRA
jgi:hypothetical protein